MDPQVIITDDRLRAIVHVPAGMSFDLAQIKAQVVARGICVGLRSAVLSEATQADEVDRDLVIAVGKAPVTPWTWKLRSEVLSANSQVSDGQMIADRVNIADRGLHDGLSVDGQPLAADSARVGDTIIGSGLEAKGDILLARKDGVFTIVDDIVWRVVDDPRGRAKRDAILFTSDDYHSAWVRLEAGEFIPVDLLHRLIKEKEIIYGLIADGIAQASRGTDKAVTVEVARGEYPQNGQDGTIEYLIDDHISYEVRDDGTLDFRAANPIQEVKQNDVLARIQPPTIGSIGMTIRGKRLDPKPGRALDPNKYRGEGVSVTGDGQQAMAELLAERDGVYNKLVTGKVQVREQVLIDGNVDMKTGNVESVYPIRITGDITAGFTVKSQCDILVDGSIEDARVSAQGNLQVKGGILPGSHRVKAHGDIQARFIEGRHIKARSVLVQNSIRHCTVYSTGEIVAQEILGGHLVAALNISAKQVGDDMEQRTVLQAGVDPMQQAHFDEMIQAKAELEPQIERKRNAVKSAVNQANDLAKKVSHLTSQAVSPKHLKRVMAEGREALEESRRKRDELDALLERFKAIEEDISTYENASSKSAKCTVQVSSAVYPGVEVRIGRHARKRMSGGCGAAIFRIEEGMVVH